MNRNQKVVLYELKAESGLTNPLSCVKNVVNEESGAYDRLTEKQEFEVLAEFAKWGLKFEN